jgi:hypothetical protein
MTAIAEARKVLVKRILEGEGKASPSERRAAFHKCDLAEPLGSFVDKIVMHANAVTQEDINAAKASGFSEDQVFEIAVCAAVGQATRLYEAAISALEAATRKD